jgi:hypothetical protein
VGFVRKSVKKVPYMRINFDRFPFKYDKLGQATHNTEENDILSNSCCRRKVERRKTGGLLLNKAHMPDLWTTSSNLEVENMTSPCSTHDRPPFGE